MKFLVVGFLESHMVFAIQDIPIYAGSLSLGGIDFIRGSAPQGDGFIGFFDWLRPDVESICGVSMYFFDNKKYISIFDSFKYADTDLEGTVTIYFDRIRSFNPMLSGDQAFGYNFLFYSKKGDVAITFKLEDLENHEVTVLEKTIQALSANF